uniref:Glucan endo-1,3-beta-D-glucosidase n=1 Tax=Oryza meridionalis TaxID=40149 RepID=A0A0E0D7Z2_9ORYZ
MSFDDFDPVLIYVAVTCRLSQRETHVGLTCQSTSSLPFPSSLPFSSPSLSCQGLWVGRQPTDGEAGGARRERRRSGCRRLPAEGAKEGGGAPFRDQARNKAALPRPLDVDADVEAVPELLRAHRRGPGSGEVSEDTRGRGDEHLVTAIWIACCRSCGGVMKFLRRLSTTEVRVRAALAALGGTGIRVVGGAPNYDLPALAHGGTAAAAGWIQAYPTVLFRFVVVGNEVAGADTQLLVPAMENVHAALAAAGLGHIKVTTSISQTTIGIHIPPSASDFTDEAKSFLSYVIPFLERTHAPLLANLYPYFIYSTTRAAWTSASRCSRRASERQPAEAACERAAAGEAEVRAERVAAGGRARGR